MDKKKAEDSTKPNPESETNHDTNDKKHLKKKDHNQEERKRKKSIRRMKVTTELIEKYRENSPFLRHVRVSDSTKGVMYVDETSAIGVINVETKENDQVWIQAFEVSKENRKGGLGKKLLKWAVGQGEAEFLSVQKKNKVAFEMYKKMGFQIFKETKSQYHMTKRNPEEFKEAFDLDLHVKDSSDFFESFEEYIEDPLMLERNEIEYQIIKERKKEDRIPVFITAVFNYRFFANVLHKVTHDVYAHSGITFDPSLQKIYSFNINGFEIESLQKSLDESMDSQLFVAVVLLTSQEYESMRRQLNRYIRNISDTKYKFINLISAVANHPESNKDEFQMICSQFVDSMFKLIDLDLTGKDSSTVRPQNLRDTTNCRVYKVYEGLAREYNMNKTNRIVQKLRRNIKNTSGSHVIEECADDVFEEGKLSDTLRRSIVKREAIRNGTMVDSDVCLYHGTHIKDKILKTNTPSFGNLLEKPKMSLFCWMNKEYAIKWAVFRAIGNFFKYTLHLEGCNIVYLPENKNAVSASAYEKMLEMISSNPIFAYVYTLQVPYQEVGLGNDSAHDEYTLYDAVCPKSVETIQITSKNIDAFISVYTDEDYQNILKNFFKYIPSKRENALTNMLMIHDYSYQFIANREIILAIFKDTKLDPSTELDEYLKQHRLKPKKVFPLRRLYHMVQYMQKCKKVNIGTPINEDVEMIPLKSVSFDTYEIDRPFFEEEQIIEDNSGDILLVEACKDLSTARKLAGEVTTLCKHYNANFFFVTDGASATFNDNNPAVLHARTSHKEWEKQHGFDPDEDWGDLRRIKEFNESLNQMKYKNYGRNLSPDEFIRRGGGMCIDYVMYTAHMFRKKWPFPKFSHVSLSIHLTTDDGSQPQHSVYLFRQRENKKTYWFESSWKQRSGVYEFESQRDAILYIVHTMVNDLVNAKAMKPLNVEIYTYDALDQKMIGKTYPEWEKMVRTQENRLLRYDQILNKLSGRDIHCNFRKL